MHDVDGAGSASSRQERRRHPRYPLRVAARLALPDGETRSCRIEDFGAGGLFIALEEAGSVPTIAGGRPLARDDQVEVQFSGEQGPSGRAQAGVGTRIISAPVARVLPTGVGLAFTDLDAASIDAVRQLVVLARKAQAPVQAPASIDPSSVKPPPVVIGDAMHTARCLLWLEHQMSSTDRSLAAVAAIATSQPVVPQVDPAARELLIDALAILQRAPEFLTPDESEPLALQDRLMTTWEAAGITVTEADAIVVEIVSRLLDAMVDDAMVKPEVRYSLRRLAIPLLKVALQDGFFFFANEEHPARRVLNRLGSLEPSIIGASRWHSVVDPLVNQVVSESDQGGKADGFVLRQSVLTEILPELDALYEEQCLRYDEMVANVVREHAKQQTLLDSLRAAADAPGPEARKNLPLELQRWLGRVEQLQAGDVVYRRVGDGEIEKLSLAVVSGDGGRFLFVDAAGEKAATMTSQEIAMQLRRGEIWMIDASKLPIVERGLFGMLNQLHERIVRQVNIDEATGLLNRKGMEARVEHALNDAVTMGSGHVLCVLELDRLGDIVRTCGEQVAGELLRNFVPVLEDNTRGKGIAGRLQAGRFAVLLENCTADSAAAAMDALRVVMETSQCKWHAERFQLTISAGLAPVDAHSGSGSAAFEAAGAAYARARAAGGNRVDIHDASETKSEDGAVARVMVKRVLADGGLQLRCQRVTPIGADASALPHFELLLGVKDANGGVALPGEFLQTAERNNLMRDVDLWVMETALRWMAENPTRVEQADGYSINLSGVTLTDDGLVERVSRMIADSGVSPGKIIFEVTESSAIDSMPVAVNFVHALKEYGCRFSLDKFGSGEASLAHLETLPIDFVKIDGSLVRDIATDPRDLMVVRSLNEIGHFLGRKTVAECVESQEVLARLRQLGVDYAQGFDIEAPIPLQ
jgi:diguanylate cyclase (GGDEF)-like protein